MICYFTLGYNTYACSPLFYNVYMKRENAGSWNSGPKRSKSEILILHNSKCLETLWRIFFGIYKTYWANKQQKGTHQVATSLGGTPYPLGRAPTLVDGGWPSSGTSFAQYFLYILKLAPVKFQDFWSCAE